MTQDAPIYAGRGTARERWTRGLTLLGGNVCGLAFDSDALSAALRHRPFLYGSHTALSYAGQLLGNWVLPMAVAVLAPRRPFLWAAATLGIGLTWSLADRVVALNGPGLLHDLLENGTNALLSLLLFCGPISLIRLQRRRGREAQARRLAEYQAWAQGAAEAQAGVWPPPIRTDGHSEGK